MLVAFRYDNGAVGSLYYSREIPSLFAALRCRSFSAARRHHVRIERPVRLCRGTGCRGSFPGFRDIRGYRAMYRDSRARSRAAPARDEPRAAIEDQR
jgi:hypothetical protein